MFKCISELSTVSSNGIGRNGRCELAMTVVILPGMVPLPSVFADCTTAGCFLFRGASG